MLVYLKLHTIQFIASDFFIKNLNKLIKQLVVDWLLFIQQVKRIDYDFWLKINIASDKLTLFYRSFYKKDN